MDDEELRIAVVMNGGVSLAVWIGGVTLEIGRLVARDSAYGEIQTLTGTSARVDVISGTSAGGVNGAFLAMAMAHHRNDLGSALTLLRSLWVTKGSVSSLLRNPFASDLRSLLDGDGYFFESLRDAFHSLQTTTPSKPEDVPLDLVLTTTLLRGLEREYADDFGSRIVDVSHRGRFQFSRGPGKCHDAFSDPAIADQLALAARSTASFPTAFEPSFCPVGSTTDQPLRPDMKGIASFPSSRFVIDGGVLDNSPIDLALNQIYHQRAAGPVRRVLAYVIPDPATTARTDRGKGDTDKPDEVDAPPELLDVGLASLVQIPAVQSISAQLDELREHNKQVKARRHARILLTQHNTTEDIDRLAEMLFQTYRAQRIADAIDYIVLEISNGLVLKGEYGLGHRGRQEWLRRTIFELASELPWIPTASPNSSGAATEQSVEGWRWGTRPIEHLARLLLDIVIRTQRVSVLLSQPISLQEFWQAAYDILEKADNIRRLDREYWHTQADKVLELLGDGKSDVAYNTKARIWLTDAIQKWHGTAYQQAAKLLHDIAKRLVELRELIFTLNIAAAATVDQLACEQTDELCRLFGYFVRNANDTEAEVAGRLLAFEVTQDALGGRGTVAEQELEFIEISARSRSTFGGPEEPAKKIAGIQLAHFGAFYKSSWRANDWLWGRVDAVHRLVRIMLDPERLRLAARQFASGQRARNVATEIARIATNSTNPGLRAELTKMLGPQSLLEAELAYLDNESGIVPEHLPRAVEAISRRLEGEILGEELPRLADAIQDDGDAGCYTSETAKSFLTRCRGVTNAGSVQADQLRDLLSICDIGRETLQREVGTDRLSLIATQAVAVAVSSVHSQKGLLAQVGRLLAVLRAPALMFYVFARNVQYRSGTGIALNAAALAAGAVVIGTQLYTMHNGGTYNKLLVWLGLAGVAAPLLWGTLRWPGIARKLGAILTVTVLLLVIGFFLGVIQVPDFSLGTWQSIAVGSIGLLLCLLALEFRPMRRRD